MSLSIRPSVHLSVIQKNIDVLTKESKLGYPCGVICLSLVPSKYLFLSAWRKFGFNKKICRKLHIVFVYYQQNSCTNAPTELAWPGGTISRQQSKSSSSPCTASVFFRQIDTDIQIDWHVAHTWQVGQSTHLIIPIQSYFCWIVFFIAVLDRSQSTNQFFHFRFFITRFFH